MRRAISAEEAASLVADGASVMIGGFLGVGTPERIVDALVARGAHGLTVIANDSARPGKGIGKLVDAGCVACNTSTHRRASWLRLRVGSWERVAAGRLGVIPRA